ncbi:sulfite exporter TauE/SafE family protein [Pontivivens nitratireducens]|uniref:Probable membrane transporter protein n=1 Tax=Pontivivens nitratireducens TaxID=2758038 RepID=A0A6G7VPA8_9RHOB|nr:sulfite exporter TauE/SafE family protein [Pontibrevibacter nitratireducens]QIK41705.1 sulfite exporter TauE/SafE family protein [Pontibrevibacter nitratireducens]
MIFFTPVFTSIDLDLILIAMSIMFFAGFVKGAVGFALPMLAVSGIGSMLPAPVAVAAVMLPAMLTNVWQAFRDGPRAAWDSFWAFRLYVLLIICVMGLVAPLVSILSTEVLFVILGLGVTFFAIVQLAGWRPGPVIGASRIAAVISGVLAGIFGGLAAVTGPPVVLYLLAREVPKVEMVRVQGVIFLLGLLVVISVHGSTGVLNATTLPLSVMLIAPAFGGMAVGLLVQDRLEQETFRKVTLLVLIVAGLNLLRRGLLG